MSSDENTKTAEEREAAVQRAIGRAKNWIDEFDLHKTPDLNKIQSELEKRTFNGEPVVAFTCRDYKEATELLVKIYKKEVPLPGLSEELTEEVIKCIPNASSYIWDYYLMTLYESSLAEVPEEERNFDGSEFLFQSLYEAYKAGLYFLVNIGPLQIGIAQSDLTVDEQFRAHKEDGPAMVWGDQKHYFWRGTEVPAEWIENKDNVDPSLALTWENIEQRRCLCEILGWERVLEQLDAKVVSEDEMGILYEADLPDSPGEKFVKVTCGTGRKFVLPVPPEMKTPHEAVAWTYQLNITDYNPEVRT